MRLLLNHVPRLWYDCKRPLGHKSSRKAHYRHVRPGLRGRCNRLSITSCQNKPVKFTGAEDVAYLARLAAEISSRTATMPIFTKEVVDPNPSEEASSPPTDVQIDEKNLFRVCLWLWSLVGTKISFSRIAIILERLNLQIKSSQIEPSKNLFVSEGTTPPSPVPIPPTVNQEVKTEVQSKKNLNSNNEVYNFELSWLAFNWRILALAEDDEIPLLERLRFLSISSSNLDEFFQKRVGGLMRQREAGLSNLAKAKAQWSPSYQLELISKEVAKMVKSQTSVFYDKLVPAMEAEGIRILCHADLNQEGVRKMTSIFKTQIEALLTPIRLDPNHPFPYLASGLVHIAVLLEDPSNTKQKTECSIITIPDSLDHWMKLPSDFSLFGNSWTVGFLPLVDLIIQHITELFGGMKVIEVHPFRVTRNAEFGNAEFEAGDLIKMIISKKTGQNSAPFVRLEVDDSAPDDLIDLLTSELGLDFDQDVYRIPNIIQQTDLIQLISLAADSVSSDLKFGPDLPQTNHRLAEETQRRQDLNKSGTSWKDRRTIFSIIRSGDILIHHPYQSFDSSVLRFMEESASDPDVLSIKSTLYRTLENSPVIEALLKAKTQGKNVTVLIDSTAKSDKGRNFKIAEKLEQVGCCILYGFIGVQTHCNTTLVIRKEPHAPNGVRSYVLTNTGNYNPSTAESCTDFGLLSCDPGLCQDVVDLFKHLTGLHNQASVGGYQKLLLCTEFNQANLLDLIDQEIQYARQGKQAGICLKMNGLDEDTIVEKLYEASQAGVRIDCIIKGVCKLRPGLTGKSENIRVISIVGRYSEHDRVVCFHNNGNPLYFLGTADWLPRGLYDRIEVVAPVLDENLKVKIRDYLSICLMDKREAWELSPDQRYEKPASRTNEAELSAPMIGHPEPTKLKNIASELGTQTALMKLYELESQTSVSWSSENANIENMISLGNH